MNEDSVRRLPAVHQVLNHAETAGLMARFGHAAVVAAVQSLLGERRALLLTGDAVEPDSLAPETVARLAEARLVADQQPVLRPAINATGILLHTGLGRSVMPEAARQAVASVTGCCNLQMELSDGARVHREHVIRQLACELTGAEDVLLVNNNAAATMLALRALAKGREVIVSRGELIEIGGSFRLPEIMSESGSTLREVGTTNKTHLADYERAITPDTALLLKVHKSNYGIVGFTKEVGIAELAALGKARGVTVLDDLGCGAMIGLETFGLPHEMTVAESLAAGADLVLSSTDKLIGGPQGGLLVGRADLIKQLRSHPLYRALRVCKLTLAALEATLRLFKNPATLPLTHPLYAMLAKTPDDLYRQADALAHELRTVLAEPVAVVEHASFLGGGSLPGEALPSYAVRLGAREGQAATVARQLREAAVPVVSRVHQDAVLLDMRTVSQAECAVIVQTFRDAFATPREGARPPRSQTAMERCPHETRVAAGANA
jgi:L-seryl-tRNA(Ser) seleniumtransferase